jgi:hypothetical protein
MTPGRESNPGARSRSANPTSGVSGICYLTLTNSAFQPAALGPFPTRKFQAPLTLVATFITDIVWLLLHTIPKATPEIFWVIKKEFGVLIQKLRHTVSSPIYQTCDQVRLLVKKIAPSDR